MHDAVHCSVGADTKGEGKQGRQSESRTADQHSRGIAYVPLQVVNHIHVTHISALLLALFEASHPAQRSVSSLLKGLASGD